MYTRIAALVVAAVMLAALGWKLYVQGRSTGRAEVQQAWDKQRAEQVAQHAKEQAEARERERALQAQADTTREEKAREIDRLNRSHAAALVSLRQRPERPAAPVGAVPTPAGDRDAGAGCTGRELYRPDAEFLLGEALRADRIRLQLAACQAAYNAARAVNSP